MTMWKGEPDWSTQQLLDAIKTNLTYLMPAFSALLVKLSNAADARAKTIVNLTWALVILTVAIAVLTAVLLGHDYAK